MTKANPGVFLSMGRLPQFVGQAAVAASVLAGGASLLNAGGAMALDCTSAGTFGISATSRPIGDFEATCPIIGTDITTLAVDYDPVALFAGSGSYNYNVATISPANPELFFREIGLGVDVNGIGTYSVSVTKEVFTSAGGMSLGTLVFNQTNSGSSYTGDLLVNPIYESLYIVDSYAVTGDTVGIDKITNTFESVPGPLPILGAGAAFGFSRKLRGRIKAARLG
jgi:hypothetical protein